MAEQTNEKVWSDITLLPEWEEKYYNIYRARKSGKWVLFKSLKPEYAQMSEFQEMMVREFEARCNLTHPNIVMINDLDPIPGYGLCIVTENVYGKTLKQVIAERKVSPAILSKYLTQVPDALSYIQENHIKHRPLRPESIIVTEESRNLKLIDVGFDQTSSLPVQDCMDDIFQYGTILKNIISIIPARQPHLRHIADRCTNHNIRHRYHDILSLRLDIERRSSRSIYTALIAFILVMCALLAWLTRCSPETKTVLESEHHHIETTK